MLHKWAKDKKRVDGCVFSTELLLKIKITLSKSNRGIKNEGYNCIQRKIDKKEMDNSHREA